MIGEQRKEFNLEEFKESVELDPVLFDDRRAPKILLNNTFKVGDYFEVEDSFTH